MTSPLDLVFTADDPALARGQRRYRQHGGLVRVAHGVSVESAAFAAADNRVRHRARISGVLARSKGGLVVSHVSAVVMHGLPWFGDYPERPTVFDLERDRGQRLRFVDKAGARSRTLRTVLVDGIEVTDLVSTAVDVALRYDRGHALVVLDDVMRRGVARAALLEELEGRSTVRGAARARRMIELAAPLSESVGESIGRLVMHDLALPAPVLQHEFRDAAGRAARVDFWFPDQGSVVEFDGLVKYRDSSMRAGRSPEQVVIDEKLREDWVRAVPEVSHVGRLIWREVMPGGSAPAVLRMAGLPVRRGVERTPAWR